MRYLITSEPMEPFLTNWFDMENNFNIEINMTVYDLVNQVYCEDGKNWKELKEDHL